MALTAAWCLGGDLRNRVWTLIRALKQATHGRRESLHK